MEPNSKYSYNNNNNKHPIAHKVSPSLLVLVISLPLLYVSLLHLPLSSLLKDTTFWFLISNSIIFIIAADSGMFSSSSSSSASDQIYDEFIKHSRAAVKEIKEQTIMEEYKVEKQEQEVSKEPESEAESPEEKEEESSKEEEVVEEEKQIVPKPKYSRSHSTEVLPLVADDSARASKWVPRSTSMVVEKRRCGMEESEYWKMSDEELNKRVEEFIRRFNREIRLEAKMMSRTTAAVY